MAVAELELTILMPCLNEAETLAACIGKAQSFLARSGIAGEVVIADNGSTDGSRQIAEAAGARVIPVPQRGYGAALAGGIAAARGRYVVMGDAVTRFDRLPEWIAYVRLPGSSAPVKLRLVSFLFVCSCVGGYAFDECRR